jgi:hypothetical protein
MTETTAATLDPSAVDFVPNRIHNPFRSKLVPAVASSLIRSFATCPECGAGIDPDVTDAIAEDNDVVWASRSPPKRNSPHTCHECGAEINILVEEKAFGVVGPRHLPDSLPELTDTDAADVYYIRTTEDGDSYLRINTHQIMLTTLG